MNDDDGRLEGELFAAWIAACCIVGALAVILCAAAMRGCA